MSASPPPKPAATRPASTSYLSLCCRCSAVVVLLISIFIGLIFTGTLSKLGLFRALADRNPMLVGLFPAMNEGLPWGYTFEKLASTVLIGQRALITGGNSGTGFATAVEIAKQGGNVILACRSASKCKEAAQKVKQVAAAGVSVTTANLDTSSLASVRAFAAEFLAASEAPLDMLFLNAGIGSAGGLEGGGLPLSGEGIELVMATNHVGHALLYELLEGRLRAAAVARVVCTSSASNFDTYPFGLPTDLKTLNVQPVGMLQYGASKLAQIVWAQEVTRRLQTEGAKNIFVNSYHPGAAATGIWDTNPLIPGFIRPLLNYMRDNAMWNAREGALTGLFLGVAVEDLQSRNIRGLYFQPQSIQVTPNAHAQNLTLQREFFDFTTALTKRT